MKTREEIVNQIVLDYIDEDGKCWYYYEFSNRQRLNNYDTIEVLADVVYWMQGAADKEFPAKE
jgi:hypothetical protein